jgi:L-lactate dehydrogenase complex protein LldG
VIFPNRLERCSATAGRKGALRMDESAFLERLRSSLGKEKRPVSSSGITVPVDEGRSSSADALSERLTRELEKVDGRIHRVTSIGDVRAVVSGILSEHDARRIVLGESDLLRVLDLQPALKDAGMKLMVCDLRQDGPRDRIRDAEFVADVGITSADYGVAESGTLALLAAPGQGRAVSLLPPVHIAVLRSSDIVYELSELFERVEKERGDLPSALTFITGPSRTADIELVLTVGVHGPKYLHLVLVSGR